jgi:hypothetical protein
MNSTAISAVAAAVQRLDVADLTRRFRCSRPTIERWLKRGLLPAPMYLLQRRVWDVVAIETAERALHAAHEQSMSGSAGAALQQRAAAKATEARALEQLESAAAAFLSRGSAGDLARLIQRFAADGKIAGVPRERRDALLRALRGAK